MKLSPNSISPNSSCNNRSGINKKVGQFQCCPTFFIGCNDLFVFRIVVRCIHLLNRKLHGADSLFRIYCRQAWAFVSGYVQWSFVCSADEIIAVLLESLFVAVQQ